MQQKTAHTILTELESNGDLKVLVANGFCFPSVIRNLELYRYVDARIKTGTPKMKAVLDAEVEFKMCERAVYNVLNSFK
ncbi:MAG: hypothetical protein K0S09_18 [Sphingobacteriaceae bacterium]|jgi:hypothetical protein|nr:hypothetical protein [Sphingobacteriaceae bacterium]